MRLKDKTALITGGTSGIGLATAKLFLAEGARVAVAGRDESAFEGVRAQLGESALMLKGDVRSISDMGVIAAQLKENFGGLDIVFANAGRAFPSPLNDINDSLYDDIMDINVRGVVYTLQAVLPDLREGSSLILNTSFVAQTGKHGISLTAAAEAAVRSLARSWSFEFLSRRIRFNAIAPGAMDTPLLGKWGMPEEALRTLKSDIAGSIPLATWVLPRTSRMPRFTLPGTNPPTLSAPNSSLMAGPLSSEPPHLTCTAPQRTMFDHQCLTTTASNSQEARKPKDFVKDATDSTFSHQQTLSSVNSRRDVLRFGGAATLGAIFGSNALMGLSAQARAQTSPVSTTSGPLDILITLYPDGTILDFSGPSEVFHRLSNTNIRFATLDGGPVTLEYGVVFGKTERLADIPKTDLILVPGGPDLRAPMKPEYLAQIRRLSDGAKHVTSEAAGSLLSAYLTHRRTLTKSRGALFASESRRNTGGPLSFWSWSKVVHALAERAGLPQLSTHTFRHLCLTDLARAGWELHEIASFAGHRNTSTTLIYIHLSGWELAAKIAKASLHTARMAEAAEVLQ